MTNLKDAKGQDDLGLFHEFAQILSTQNPQLHEFLKYNSDSFQAYLDGDYKALYKFTEKLENHDEIIENKHQHE